MKIIESDLEFDFTDAVDCIKFDGSDHGCSHCMKAVDFVIELAGAYLFVEVKDPSHPNVPSTELEKFKAEVSGIAIRDKLIGKFRDSFVYRWAEQSVDKPIHFLSLISLDDELLNSFQDELKRNLPLARAAKWKRDIAVSCQVVNLEAWNRNFPKWTVRRLSNAPS